jgi:phosphoribosylamine--glycine ligase
VTDFLLISKSGDGIGLAHRIQLEGNNVKFYLEDEKGESLYDGILERVPDWKKAITSDTIVVCDMVGVGKEMDELRKGGIPVVGGCKLADELELDRAFGLSVAENHGITIPESESFQDFKSAVEYLEDQEEDDGFVFKPEGNKEGVKTTVSRDTREMIALMGHFENLWKGKVDFILQRVVKGVEISSEVWCASGKIIDGSYNNTLEQKRFLNDDLGPNTGCMGSTVKFNLCPRLFTETFAKLTPWLNTSKFNGPLDINCIIDQDGVPHMLEWTSRFGYSAIYAMIEGLGMPVSDFLAAMASNQEVDFGASSQWLGALRMTIPPYPHCEDAPMAKGIPIMDLDLEDPHTWPLDVMIEGGQLVCSGFDGILCELSGAAESLDAMWGGLYGRAAMIHAPEIQYRTDDLLDVERRLYELQDAGYIEEPI